MSAVNSFETGLLQLIFTNTDLANVAAGISPPGSFYIALFTASPGETGLITNEATYGGYARVEIGRMDDMNIALGQATNLSDLLFPECTSGSETITHFGICTGLSGANVIIYGALSSPLLMAAQVQPRIAAGSLIINLD